MMGDFWQILWPYVVLGLTISSSQAFHWTDTLLDNAVVPACVGGNLTLPWSFVLTPGETIQDIRYNFRSGEREQELIGTYSADHFFAMPAFSQRVQYVDNGSLVLNHVTLGDSGKYTIEIVVRRAGSSFSDNIRTAYADVTEPPSTSGNFHVAQDRKATHVNETGSWHVTLACGQFVSLGHPAVDILWKTPSGDMNSTKYQDGWFYLRLPNPVEGGNYSCLLPLTYATTGCLPAVAQLAGGATLVVDETKARLTLLEAENTDLKALVKSLGNSAETLQNATGSLHNTTQTLESKTKVLQVKADTLESKVNSLFPLGGANRPSATFHARLQSSQHVSVPHHVILGRVLLNEGDAYNGTSGVFTAPYNGTYFLIATTADGSRSPNNTADFAMMVDDNEVCWTYSKYVDWYETSTCHVTVQLRAGQRAWLRSNDLDGYYSADYTVFSGFLIGTE